MPAKLPVFDRVSEEDLADAPKGNWVGAITTPLNDQLAANKTLMNGGLTFGQNIQSEVREIDVIIPDAWTAISLQNGFANNAGTAGYVKHQDGTVELRGNITTASVAPVVIGTLPIGYRPAQKFYYPVYANAAAGYISIDTTGVVTAEVGINTVHIQTRFLSSDATPPVPSVLPVTFTTKFTASPLAVIAISVLDTTKTESKPVGCVPNPDWSYGSFGGKPGIKINNVCGLPYNRKYRIKLLIIGG